MNGLHYMYQMIKKVEKISNFECKDWIINKHYAKRMCSISYAYGLFIDGQLNGVCTFGFPPNYNYNNGKCVFNYLNHLVLYLMQTKIKDIMVIYIKQQIGYIQE